MFLTVSLKTRGNIKNISKHPKPTITNVKCKYSVCLEEEERKKKRVHLETPQTVR